MMKPYKASCKCKAIQFEIGLNEDQTHISICHCNDCQKITSSHFTNVDYRGEVIFEGDEHLRVYDSSNWAERGFCSICGSSIYYRFKNDNLYSFAVGLFEDKSDFKLTKQIFIDKKADYIEIANQTEEMTEAECFASVKDEL